jgi:protein MpaA
MTPFEESLSFGFTPISFISPRNFAKSIIDDAQKASLIKHFCSSVKQYYFKYNWNEEPCAAVKWQASLLSKNGHPLIYAEFGEGKETTLLLGGVHPDEITPIPITFRMAKFLSENQKAFDRKKLRVIVAPLVNPDGFLRNIATRTNSNGIDLNRNFFTLDWYDKAKKLWQDRRERAGKHFPGYFPNSEVETIFQIQLIDTYKPDKILSVHAPLGFLDYDGPGDRKPQNLTPAERRAKQLVTTISEESENYKVVDYTFYPGSLGNYAGNERNIPTVTLELETTEARKVDIYWKQFFPGIMQSINYRFTTTPDLTKDNASPFSVEYHEARKQTI